MKSLRGLARGKRPIERDLERFSLCVRDGGGGLFDA